MVVQIANTKWYDLSNSDISDSDVTRKCMAKPISCLPIVKKLCEVRSSKFRDYYSPRTKRTVKKKRQQRNWQAWRVKYNQFMMKLFETTNVSIICECQKHFAVKFPSELLTNYRRRLKF